MLLLSVVIVIAVAFAWFTLRDINTPTNVPLKKADEVNNTPPAHSMPVTDQSEELIAIQKPVLVAAKTKKTKNTSGEKVKKTPGRKKKL